jgi:uncharacterized protein (TIGR03435 family)
MPSPSSSRERPESTHNLSPHYNHRGAIHSSPMDLRTFHVRCRQYSGVVATAALLLASLTPSVGRAQTVSTPSFEVVTIRPTAEDTRWAYKQSPDEMELTGVTARILVADAYGLDNIVGGPAWIDSMKYVVHAKFDPSVAAKLASLSYQDRMNQNLAMLRPVLEERLALKTHSESQEKKAYALVLAKGGPKFSPAPSGAADPNERTASYDGHQWTVNREPMSFLALQLSRIPDVGRNVVDQTGLKGDYKFTFDWSAKLNLDISVFTALEEQLGLKLEPTKAPVEVLVIDHIAPPSEN